MALLLDVPISLGEFHFGTQFSQNDAVHSLGQSRLNTTQMDKKFAPKLRMTNFLGRLKQKPRCYNDANLILNLKILVGSSK